jgi:hypothetical protein
MSSSTGDLRVELAYLRDNLVQAISHGETSFVEGGLDTYEALVTTFLDILTQFGTPYDRAAALNELHSLGGGWSEIEWVRDDYREIADAALDSGNPNVLFPVLYFPVHLSRLAYAKGDYYIFIQFLNWLPYLYYRASTSLDDETFKLVRDRLQSYLREVGELNIWYDLEDATDVEAVQRRCEFAQGIFVIFNRLLKTAYDQRRVEDFQEFASTLQVLYEPELSELRTWRGTREGGVIGSNEAPSSVTDARLECISEITRLRRIVFLGLEAWLLRDYEAEKLTYHVASKMRGSLHLPATIPELWRLYLKARERRYEEELDWSWWESREHSGRTAYSGIDFGLLLLTPVLLRMVGVAQSSKADWKELDRSRELRFLVGNGSGPLIDRLDQIASSGKLRELEPNAPWDRIAQLREMFIELAGAQERDERLAIMQAPVSAVRVDEVKRNILGSWREGGHLRRIVQLHGEYTQGLGPPPSLEFLSVHQLDRKEIYVDEGRFSAHDWGSEYGRALARVEDEVVIEKVFASVPMLSSGPVDPSEIVPKLDQVLTAPEFNPENQTIVIAGSLASSWALADTGRFRYDTTPPGGDELSPTGFFEKIPVYQLHTAKQSCVLIADLRRLGVWRQYKPEPRSGAEYLDHALLFELEVFDEASARKRLEEQPLLFLRDDRGEERSFAERVELLRESVRVLVLEQIDFEVLDPQGGRAVLVTD